MKRILRVALVVVVLVVAVPYLVGLGLDERHTASSRARYASPPEVVFGHVGDFAKLPEWREGTTRVEALPPIDGKPAWLEHTSFGPLPYVIEELDPPRRLVARIAADDLGFGGTWTYEVAPDGSGCVLTITEDGTVENPAFRTVSLLTGHHGTQQQYLRDLGRRLGEEVEPEKVE